MRANTVIKNPHITDLFFHSKLKDFVAYWLHVLKTLDAEWYWFRYEYQARASTHAHGCAKLKNDPGLYELVKIAALGWMEEKANESNQTEPQLTHYSLWPACKEKGNSILCKLVSDHSQ